MSEPMFKPIKSSEAWEKAEFKPGAILAVEEDVYVDNKMFMIVTAPGIKKRGEHAKSPADLGPVTIIQGARVIGDGINKAYVLLRAVEKYGVDNVLAVELVELECKTWRRHPCGPEPRIEAPAPKEGHIFGELNFEVKKKMVTPDSVKTLIREGWTPP